MAMLGIDLKGLSTSLYLSTVNYGDDVIEMIRSSSFRLSMSVVMAMIGMKMMMISMESACVGYEMVGLMLVVRVEMVVGFLEVEGGYHRHWVLIQLRREGEEVVVMMITMMMMIVVVIAIVMVMVMVIMTVVVDVVAMMMVIMVAVIMGLPVQEPEIGKPVVVR